MKKKLYRWVVISVLILLVSLKVSAQSKLITGVVKDGSGSTLPGVGVVLKGTTTGTVTDADGVFSISASREDVLVFSFIGYSPQEIPVGQQTNINVLLVEDIR